VRADDLNALLQRLPGPLLRLHLTGGRTFDIDDPEDVIVGRTAVEMLVPGQPSCEAVIAIVHIVWAEAVAPR
jgi:hypothetical protein